MYEQGTRLLGLEGFAVTAVVERGDELDLEVELVASAGVCPACGRTCEVKERPVVRVRDLSIAGRRTFLRWRKRRFRCQACARTFTESDEQLPARQRVTRRFRVRLFERAREGGAHAEVARGEETTRYQVGRAFALGAAGVCAAHAEERPPRWLALDEAHHEILEGRSRRVVERYLRSLSPERLASIEVVSIDPYDAYRQAVRAVVPDATVVCDPFHLVRGANEALDSVRRERQRGARSRWRTTTRKRASPQGWRQDLFYGRHRLLRGRERLSFGDRRALCELFEREPLVAEAWGLKEAFRAIYRSATRAEAEERLERFLAAVERAAIPSFAAFAAGVRRWREELLAYFDEPVTNGYAEGVINKVKVIKRRAYGLPTFAGFRRRILVACG